MSLPCIRILQCSQVFRIQLFRFFLANLSFSTVSAAYILPLSLLELCFSLLVGLITAILFFSLLLCSGRYSKLSGYPLQVLVPVGFILLSLTHFLFFSLTLILLLILTLAHSIKEYTTYCNQCNTA